MRDAARREVAVHASGSGGDPVEEKSEQALREAERQPAVAVVALHHHDRRPAIQQVGHQWRAHRTESRFGRRRDQVDAELVDALCRAHLHRALVGRRRLREEDYHLASRVGGVLRHRALALPSDSPTAARKVPVLSAVVATFG